MAKKEEDNTNKNMDFNAIRNNPEVSLLDKIQATGQQAFQNTKSGITGGIEAIKEFGATEAGSRVLTGIAAAIAANAAGVDPTITAGGAVRKLTDIQTEEKKVKEEKRQFNVSAGLAETKAGVAAEAKEEKKAEDLRKEEEAKRQKQLKAIEAKLKTRANSISDKQVIESLKKQGIKDIASFPEGFNTVKRAIAEAQLSKSGKVQPKTVDEMRKIFVKKRKGRNKQIDVDKLIKLIERK